MGEKALALISDGYRRLNTRLHRRSRGYGAKGARWADAVLDIADRFACADVLDYGCGKQSLSRAIGGGLVCRDYDPAVPKVSKPPKPADLVVCTDVMEHVEAECIDAVLDHIAGLARKAVFFVISLERGGRKLPDGRYAHVSVYPAEWWIERLSARFGALEQMPPRAETAELVIVARR